MTESNCSTKKQTQVKPVERLFPFALRARLLLVGREALQRSKKKLEFVLITTDLSENSRNEIQTNFAGVPIIERYSSSDIEKWFNFRGTKVIGFKKSSLA